ncbi:MAG: CoA-binding protein, partial [Hyphomicrobiales bacterium]
CIYTFSGGTAALAADMAGAANLPMTSFTAATSTALKKLLPDFASIGNPVDTTADILRNRELSAQCLRAVCADPGVGTVLFPIPMDYGDITADMAKTIIDVSAETDTLIVPVWMSRRLGGGFQLMENGGLLPFLSLSDAISAIAKAFPWHIEEAPSASSSLHSPDGQEAGGVRLVSEAVAKSLLRDAGLPIPQGLVVKTAQEAVEHAQRLAFPVVMKVVSAQIPHKTEAGGVKLSICSVTAVREAFDAIHASAARYAPNAAIDGILVEKMLPPGGREVLVGVHRDPAFGLVLTFGLGGIFVETIRDVAHRMIPLSREDAHALVHEIKYVDILKGVRGQAAADISALEDLIVQISDFAWKHRESLHEMELNPVWVGSEGQGAMPMDALVAFRANQYPAGNALISERMDEADKR